MSYQLYKLTFPNGLHLDAGSFGYETSEVMIHSDTLFSALCCCANLLEGDDGVQKLKDGLVISSAFPFAGNRLFFPKPLNHANPDFDDTSYEHEKAWRKVRFIEEPYLRLALKEELAVEKLFTEEKEKNGCWFKQGKPFEIYKTVEHPRVVIDRVTQQTTIFYFQEVHFDEGNGLFFLADWGNDLAIRDTFLASLRLLGDEGIGSDGTVGKGLFQITEGETLDEFETTAKDKFYLLSLYHPTETEIPNIQVASSNYDLIIRKGWSSNWGGMDLRRRSLKMFTEGSVISTYFESKPKGDVSNVLEDNGKIIFRSGKAYIFY